MRYDKLRFGRRGELRSVLVRSVGLWFGRHVVFGSVLAGYVGVCQGWAGEVGSVLVYQVGCGSAGLVRLDWVRSGLVT